MRFEKWQALGNDYAIVEERELPFELTPGRVRAICARHTGIGSDGVLLIRETGERGCVAEVRIFNPDGSEAELSGNGVRQAVMYLRRKGWSEHDRFSVLTAAGEIRPRIDGEMCTMDIGRVRLRAESDFPTGGEDGRGTLTSGGRDFDFQFVQVGNPQVAIEVADGLEELDLGALRPGDRAARAVPEPHERVVLAPDRRRRRSGRGSSSAGWGRRCPPAPARRVRRWPPCSAGWTAR